MDEKEKKRLLEAGKRRWKRKREKDKLQKEKEQSATQVTESKPEVSALHVEEEFEAYLRRLLDSVPENEKENPEVFKELLRKTHQHVLDLKFRLNVFRDKELDLANEEWTEESRRLSEMTHVAMNKDQTIEGLAKKLKETEQERDTYIGDLGDAIQANSARVEELENAKLEKQNELTEMTSKMKTWKETLLGTYMHLNLARKDHADLSVKTRNSIGKSVRETKTELQKVLKLVSQVSSKSHQDYSRVEEEVRIVRQEKDQCEKETREVLEEKVNLERKLNENVAEISELRGKSKTEESELRQMVSQLQKERDQIRTEYSEEITRLTKQIEQKNEEELQSKAVGELELRKKVDQVEKEKLVIQEELRGEIGRLTEENMEAGKNLLDVINQVASSQESLDNREKQISLITEDNDSLKVQVQEAQSRLDIQEKEKKEEVEKLRHEVGVLQSSGGEMQDESRKELSKIVEVHDAQIANLRNENASLQDELKASRGEGMQVREELSRVLRERDKAISEKRMIEGEISHLADESSSFREENEEIVREMAKIMDENETHKEEKDNMRSQMLQVATRLESAEEQLNFQSDQFTGIVNNLEKEKAEIEGELSRMQEEVEALRQQKDSLKRELDVVTDDKNRDHMKTEKFERELEHDRQEKKVAIENSQTLALQFEEQKKESSEIAASLREEAEILRKEKESLQSKLADLKKEKAVQEHEIQDVIEQLSGNSETLKTLEGDKAVLDESVKDLQKENESLRGELTSQASEFDRLTAGIKAMEEELQRTRDQSEDEKRLRAQLETQTASSDELLAKKNALLKNATNRAQKSERELTDLRKRHEATLSSISETKNNEVTELYEKLEKAGEERDHAEEKLESMQRTHNDTVAQLQEVQNIINSKEAENSALRDSDDSQKRQVASLELSIASAKSYEVRLQESISEGDERVRELEVHNSELEQQMAAAEKKYSVERNSLKQEIRKCQSEVEKEASRRQAIEEGDMKEASQRISELLSEKNELEIRLQKLTDKDNLQSDEQKEKIDSISLELDRSKERERILQDSLEEAKRSGNEEVSGIKEQKDALQQQVQELEADMESLRTANEQNIQDIMEQLKLKDEEIEALQAQVGDMLSEIESLSAKSGERENHVAELVTDNFNLVSRCQEVESTCSSLDSQMRIMKNERDEARAQAKSLLESKNSLEKSMNQLREETTVSSDRQASVVEDLQNQLSTWQAEKNRDEERIKVLCEEQELSHTQIAELEKRSSDEDAVRNKEAEEKNEEVVERLKEVERISSERDASLSKLEEKRTENEELKQKLDELSHLEEKVVYYQKQITNSENEKLMLSEELGVYHTQQENLRKELYQKNDELTGICEAAKDVERKVEIMEAQLKESREQCDHYINNVTRLEKEKVALLDAGKTVQKQDQYIADLELRLKELTTELQRGLALQKSIDDTKKELALSHEANTLAVQEAQKIYTQMERERSSHAYALQRSEDTVASLRERLSVLGQRLGVVEMERDGYADGVNVLKKEQEYYRERMASIQEELGTSRIRREREEKSSHMILESKNEMDRLADDNSRLLGTVTRMEEQINSCVEQNTALRKHVDQLATEKSQLSRLLLSREQQLNKLEDVEQRYSAVKRERDDLKTSSNFEPQVRRILEEQEVLVNEKAQLSRDVHRLKLENEQLRRRQEIASTATARVSEGGSSRDVHYILRENRHLTKMRDFLVEQKKYLLLQLMERVEGEKETVEFLSDLTRGEPRGSRYFFSPSKCRRQRRVSRFKCAALAVLFSIRLRHLMMRSGAPLGLTRRHHAKTSDIYWEDLVRRKEDELMRMRLSLEEEIRKRGYYEEQCRIKSSVDGYSVGQQKRIRALGNDLNSSRKELDMIKSQFAQERIASERAKSDVRTLLTEKKAAQERERVYRSSFDKMQFSQARQSQEMSYLRNELEDYKDRQGRSSQYFSGRH